jgi:hypothetical protein
MAKQHPFSLKAPQCPGRILFLQSSDVRINSGFERFQLASSVPETGCRDRPFPRRQYIADRSLIRGQLFH